MLEDGGINTPQILDTGFSYLAQLVDYEYAVSFLSEVERGRNYVSGRKNHILCVVSTHTRSFVHALLSLTEKKRSVACLELSTNSPVTERSESKHKVI